MRTAVNACHTLLISDPEVYRIGHPVSKQYICQDLRALAGWSKPTEGIATPRDVTRDVVPECFELRRVLFFPAHIKVAGREEIAVLRLQIMHLPLLLAIGMPFCIWNW